MARQAMSSHAIGRRQITLQGHFVDRKRTAEIRQRSIAILRGAMLAGGERAHAALSVIEDGLRPPMAYGGQQTPKAVLNQWRPEQRILLTVLAEALDVRLAPNIAGAIRETLRREHKFSRWPSSRRRAQEILKRHPPSLTEELVEVIEHPWRESQDDQRKDVARRLLEAHQDLDGLGLTLNDALAETHAASANPLPLLHDLADQDPRIATLLLERGIDHPDEPLTEHLAVLLRERPARLVVRLWNSGHPALRRLAAKIYAHDPRNLSLADQKRVSAMLRAADSDVRSHAVLAVTRLGQIDAPLALKLATKISPISAGQIDQVLQALDMTRATGNQIAAFLGWLESTEQLSWKAGEFIREVAPRVGERVVRLLISCASSDRHIAATSQLAGLLDHMSAEQYRYAVETIRNAALDPDLAWRLAYLVEPIGRGDYSELLNVLVEWLADSDLDKVGAACSLLSRVPSRVIFDQHEALASVVDSANLEQLNRIRRAMFAAARSGVTTRGYGEAADEDVRRLQRSETIAGELADGSAAQTFFVDLAQSFHASIEVDLRTDEEEDSFDQ